MEAIEKYMKDANSYPLLTFKQEKSLSQVIRKFHGGKQKQAARDELMSCNLRLVVKIANNFRRSNPTVPLMDLISAGNIGLVRAVDYYHPSKFKTRFSTYAFVLIKQAILTALHDICSEVSIPPYLHSKRIDLKKMEKSDGSIDMKDEEISEILGVSVEVLKRIRMANVFHVSLDKIRGVNPNGSTFALIDTLEDVTTPKSDEGTIKEEMRSHVLDAVDNLTEKERDIIMSLFFDGQMLREVGKRHGVTPEAIRQRKDTALNKLKWKLKNKSL